MIPSRHEDQRSDATGAACNAREEDDALAVFTAQTSSPVAARASEATLPDWLAAVLLDFWVDELFADPGSARKRLALDPLIPPDLAPLLRVVLAIRTAAMQPIPPGVTERNPEL